MNSLKVSARRAGSIFATAALVLATAIPGLASAATITQRTIELSSSVKDATDVSYKVTFTAKSDGTNAVVLDFCDSPVINAACTPPADFDATDVSATGGTATAVDANTVKVVLSAEADIDDVVEVTLAEITNPSATGPFYARVVTYASDTNANGYTSAAGQGTFLDTGSVAMSITEGFGVTGTVRESLLFCVSGADTITSGCAGGITTPNLALGSGGVLNTTTSEGTIYSQISTNAVSGAVVSLKSDAADCGGLVRAGASSKALGCGITPLGTAAATIADNSAKFGLKLAGLGAATGTVQGTNGYDATNFYLRYAAGNGTGVTSTYGDKIFDTNNAPVNDGTADLKFGANISNVTPAGTYSAAFSLIATGKF